MSDPRHVLGTYVAGTTLWHRLGPGWKYLAFLVLVVPAVAAGDERLTLVSLGLSLAAVASTRAPARQSLALPWGLMALLAVLVSYQALSGRLGLGIAVAGGMLVAVYASRLLLLTTPMPVLIDALVRVVAPLRRVGVDPERFGLAVAIMVRSIPFIAGAFGDVRQAARARGLERSPLTAVTPVVVQAVAYARATGEALAARGLGESGD